MSEAAARARIEELGGTMGVQQETRPVASTMWALGDYHRFAKELMWDVGPVLVEACGIEAGRRVLDVAAGTGNVAIRAAEAGADVVAADVTPENFAAGRREAEAVGVELEWVEADAQALPFEDDAFDVVTSSFGAMFAPDHERVADELLRMCRPGGVVGMLNFTPEGLASGFFAVLGPHLPPPPAGAQPPLLWGSEDHVRELFGDRVASLELSRRSYVEHAGSPRAYCDFFRETFGPAVAAYASLEGDAERAAELDRAFLGFVTDANGGDGPVALEYEYLLVVARKP